MRIWTGKGQLGLTSSELDAARQLLPLLSSHGVALLLCAIPTFTTASASLHEPSQFEQGAALGALQEGLAWPVPGLPGCTVQGPRAAE